MSMTKSPVCVQHSAVRLMHHHAQRGCQVMHQLLLPVGVTAQHDYSYSKRRVAARCCISCSALWYCDFSPNTHTQTLPHTHKISAWSHMHLHPRHRLPLSHSPDPAPCLA